MNEGLFTLSAATQVPRENCPSMAANESRPEATGALASAHYANGEEIRYTAQNEKLQAELASCCLSHLEQTRSRDEDRAHTPSGALLLDLGSGSGLSSAVIRASGYTVVGIDVARDMLRLDVAHVGFTVHANLSSGIPFLRPGAFDGAISVSALQWLDPRAQSVLFHHLAIVLRPGAQMVFQFYPRPEEAQPTVDRALAEGLQARLVIDMPHATRARKLFLCASRPALTVSSTAAVPASPMASSTCCGYCPLAWPMPATCSCNALRAGDASDERVPVFPPLLDGEITCCERARGGLSGAGTWIDVAMSQCCCHTLDQPAGETSKKGIRGTNSALARLQHQHMKYVRRVDHALAQGGVGTASSAGVGGRVVRQAFCAAGSMPSWHEEAKATATAIDAAVSDSSPASLALYLSGSHGAGCEDALLLHLSGANADADADADGSDGSDILQHLGSILVESLPQVHLMVEHAHLSQTMPPAPAAVPSTNPSPPSPLKLPGAAAIAAISLSGRVDGAGPAQAARAAVDALLGTLQTLRARDLTACGARMWLQGEQPREWSAVLCVAVRRRAASAAAVGAADGSGGEVIRSDPPAASDMVRSQVSTLQEEMPREGSGSLLRGRKRAKRSAACAVEGELGASWTAADIETLLSPPLATCLAANFRQHLAGVGESTGP